jgi:hypothetical protein
MNQAKRIQWVLGTLLMLTGNVAAKGEDLTVYLQNTAIADFITLAAAKGVTTKMFAGIGVRIHWEVGAPRRRDGSAIAMEFDSSASARFRPDALAFATPFDDSHTCIHIFYDRVLGTVPRKLAAGLLGHVMSHEITHVLERRDRHSATGVMKAQWTTADYEAMAVHPLAFEAQNVEGIGEYWSTRPTVSAR